MTRSGTITGARIILALLAGSCESTVGGVSRLLGLSPNSTRKAIRQLVSADILVESEPQVRAGTPPTRYYTVKMKKQTRQDEELLWPAEGGQLLDSEDQSLAEEGS